MGSSRSTGTSASEPPPSTHIPTTLKGFFTYYVRALKTLDTTAIKAVSTKPADVTQGDAMIAALHKTLRQTVLIHAPSVLWDSAVHQGLTAWINSVADLVGKDVVPHPPAFDEPEEPWAVLYQRIVDTVAAVDKINATDHVVKQINSNILPLSGIPGGVCLVGFTEAVEFPEVSKAPSEVTKDGPYTAILLLSEQIIALFPASLDPANEHMRVTPLFTLGTWHGHYLAEHHIIHSLIQVLNLSASQRKINASFGFKRFMKQLIKSYNTRFNGPCPIYEYPNGVIPPTHQVRTSPKIPGMKAAKDVRHGVVNSDLTVVERFLGFRNGMEKYTLYAPTGHGDDSSLIIRELRRARIFEIPSELYYGFYRQADKYTTEQIAGFEWEPTTSENKDNEWSEDHMTSMDFVQCVNEAGTHLELPEKRPFNCCYFGYQPPPVLNPSMYSIYNLKHIEERAPIAAVEIVGHLVAETTVTTCLGIRLVNGRQIYGYLVEHKNKEWLMPYTLAPWIVSALIDWINEHQTVVQDDSRLPSYMRVVKKALKEFRQARDAPPPYYTVYMRDLVINKSVRKTFSSRFKKIIDWSHRWEVRGHYMVRIKRGAIPIDPKLDKVLRKRKYQVYTEENPPFDTWQKLEARGVPLKRANEWLAVLVSFRQDFVKGPEDKPLVPSVRKSARYAEENNEASVFDNQDIDEQPD